MKRTIRIDRTDRVVLPKSLRDKPRLSPGENLLDHCDDERITLNPMHPQATLQKEHGIWVYVGESTPASIPDMLNQNRETRIRELED